MGSRRGTPTGPGEAGWARAGWEDVSKRRKQRRWQPRAGGGREGTQADNGPDAGASKVTDSPEGGSGLGERRAPGGGRCGSRAGTRGPRCPHSYL